MNRTPPQEIRRQLRQEVGFGCPIPECSSPYLTYHHFDPPWRIEEHQNPEGMIALCRPHHDASDAGAYTKRQLHQFKTSAVAKAGKITGRFEWMRSDLLTVVGGSYFYETGVAAQIGMEPIVWFNRDDGNHFLLNLRMFTTSKEPRAVICDNHWIALGTPSDLVCPPSGKSLEIRYDRGDQLKIEFLELTKEAARDRYSGHGNWYDQAIQFGFPLTAVEICMKAYGSGIEFSPRETKVSGGVGRNMFFYHQPIGFRIGREAFTELIF